MNQLIDERAKSEYMGLFFIFKKQASAYYQRIFATARNHSIFLNQETKKTKNPQALSLKGPVFNTFRYRDSQNGKKILEL